MLTLARKAFASGLTVGGTKYDVTIIDKDSQSNPQRSAQVANDLINGVERRPAAHDVHAGDGQPGVGRG